MNKSEAESLISGKLKDYRSKTYQELTAMIDSDPIAYELTGSDEKTYQLEIEVFWADKKDGNVRVSGSIDDGGLKAFFPLTCSFIKVPSGDFIGE